GGSLVPRCNGAADLYAVPQFEKHAKYESTCTVVRSGRMSEGFFPEVTPGQASKRPIRERGFFAARYFSVENRAKPNRLPTRKMHRSGFNGGRFMISWLNSAQSLRAQHKRELTRKNKLHRFSIES